MQKNISINISSNTGFLSTAMPIEKKILLVKPPFFSPLTPPLGIALLKSFLEERGYIAQCEDFNVDSELWGIHHQYFTVLQNMSGETRISDGYTKLWSVINTHMLAFVNGADQDTCVRILETILPMYGIPNNRHELKELNVIIDRFFNRLTMLADHFSTTDFSVVGTSTYTTSLASSLFFLRRLKQKNPSLLTVMGGGVFADDLASGSDNLQTLLKEYPFIDHVILGEGELLFLKLLQGEFRGKRVISIDDIQGNTLPMHEAPTPNFSDFDLDKYYHLSIEGARSCPFECSFCSETIQWGSYRKKPKNLLSSQMIHLVQQYNNNTYFMGDSLMNPYIMGLSSELLQHDEKVLYDGYLRADKIATNRERVKIWARSGMCRARLGVESASGHVLDLMHKMTTPETIEDVLKSLSNAGIRTTTYWIVGFPGEMESDFQETLDFIRKNHRYIYELEAHPYCYFPYGQISSRLYKCTSLYPEFVTDVIKFQLWDVVDVEPDRRERYARLRRISEVAAELNLPNIYTMAERYAAEERWHRLHPLAMEVYEDSFVSRSKVAISERSLPVFSREWIELDASNLESSQTLCYHVSVRKRLDEMTLENSLIQLVNYNEALQMWLQGDQYTVHDSRPDAQIMTVYHFAQEELVEIKDICHRVTDILTHQIQPEPGLSVKVGLIQLGQISHLLIVAHRAIVDTRSIVLLFEDLFRIYEQIANEKMISLLPVKKLYTDFLRAWMDDTRINKTKELRPLHLHSGYPRETDNLEVHSTRLSLPENLCERMLRCSLVEYGVSVMEILTGAVLKSIGDDRLSLDIRADYRLVDTSLSLTAGSLTNTYSLTPSSAVQQDLYRWIRTIQQSIRKLLLEQVVDFSNVSVAERILLNLEYLTEAPWMGGDAWMPEGFIINDDLLQNAYGLEIIPTISQNNISLLLIYHRTPMPQAQVDKLLRRFSEEAASILQSCEEYPNIVLESVVRDQQVVEEWTKEEFNFIV